MRVSPVIIYSLYKESNPNAPNEERDVRVIVGADDAIFPTNQTIRITFGYYLGARSNGCRCRHAFDI